MFKYAMTLLVLGGVASSAAEGVQLQSPEGGAPAGSRQFWECFTANARGAP